MGRYKGSKNGHYTKITKVCKTCGKSFSCFPSIAQNQNYCSRKCRPQHFHKSHISWLKGTRGLVKFNKGSFQKGNKNINWQSGKYQNYYNRGVYKPNHPRTNKYGYIPRYIDIMEQHLGRQLKPKEIVHHINKIKNDDRLENLMLFPNNSAHMKYHAQLRKK